MCLGHCRHSPMRIVIPKHGRAHTHTHTDKCNKSNKSNTGFSKILRGRHFNVFYFAKFNETLHLPKIRGGKQKVNFFFNHQLARTAVQYGSHFATYDY